MARARFADLKKVPKQPATRLMAMGNSKLNSELGVPANASVSEVLDDLEKQAPDLDASLDMLRLMAMALPARERTWWACLAARDVIGKEIENTPLSLEIAEKWVRKPSDELRDAARKAVENADIDDETVNCATSVVFFDDTLGTGDLAQYPAPPGASQNAVLAMVAKAVTHLSDDPVEACNILVDRAVDIARGGSGQITTSSEKEPAS